MLKQFRQPRKACSVQREGLQMRAWGRRPKRWKAPQAGGRGGRSRWDGSRPAVPGCKGLAASNCKSFADTRHRRGRLAASVLAKPLQELLMDGWAESEEVRSRQRSGYGLPNRTTRHGRNAWSRDWVTRVGWRGLREAHAVHLTTLCRNPCVGRQLHKTRKTARCRPRSLAPTS